MRNDDTEADGIGPRPFILILLTPYIGMSVLLLTCLRSGDDSSGTSNLPKFANALQTNPQPTALGPASNIAYLLQAAVAIHAI